MIISNELMNNLNLLLPYLLYTVMLLLVMTVAGAVVRVSVIPYATIHIYYVRGCCTGPATGLCECINHKAAPLGDRHTASVPLCLDWWK